MPNRLPSVSVIRNFITLSHLENKYREFDSEYKDLRTELKAMVTAQESEHRLEYYVAKLGRALYERDSYEKRIFKHCLKTGCQSYVLKQARNG